jgi:hypothetical protein
LNVISHKKHQRLVFQVNKSKVETTQQISQETDAEHTKKCLQKRDQERQLIERTERINQRAKNKQLNQADVFKRLAYSFGFTQQNSDQSELEETN